MVMADKDGNGSIDEDEFICAMKTKSQKLSEIMR